MCGQGGITMRDIGSLPMLGTLADNLALELQARGRDATGILAMGDDFVTIQKDVVSADRFTRRRKRFSDQARTVMVHTRYATVGSARDPRNAHPVVSGRCAAVHNGTIWNDVDVFAELQVKRTADVDSEVIPAIVDFVGWDDAEEGLGLLFGGAATAIVNADHTNEVLLARLTAFPMVYMENEEDGIVVWASTEAAIVKAWRKTYGNVRMGEFYELAEWQTARFKNGMSYAINQIPQDPNPPYTERQPAAGRVIVPSATSGRSYRPNTRTSAYSTDDRSWSRDISESEFEQLVLRGTREVGRWENDVYVMDDDDLAAAEDEWQAIYAASDAEVEAARTESIFDMTDEEFRKWCKDQGWGEE